MRIAISILCTIIIFLFCVVLFCIVAGSDLSDLDVRYSNSISKYNIYCRTREELDKMIFSQNTFKENVFVKTDLVYCYDTSEVYQFDGKNMNLIGYLKKEK